MKTIIEINGRKYDARTGKVITTSDSSSKPTSGTPNRGGSMDGISKQNTSHVFTDLTPRPVQEAPKLKKVIQPAVRSLDIKPVSRKPQKSKTLLRTAVKKPQKQSPKIHSTSTISPSNLEKSATGRGILLKRIPNARLERAGFASKSSFINRFDRSNKIKPQLSDSLTVKSAPTAQSAPVSPPSLPLKNDSNKSEFVFNHPNNNYSAEKHNRVHKVSLKRRILNGFGASQKFVAIGATVAAIIVLGGFLAYQNIPSVGMRIAASKAGFSGKLPNSTPAGYAFKGPILSSKGNIVLTYKSNSDDRKFIVSQKPTEWTSESLLTNYLVDSKLRYQTYRDKGMTVYIYNESNATWVDKGIWYTVNGDGSLNSEQILEIASSI